MATSTAGPPEDAGSAARPTERRTVLVTGASGLLGTHLLARPAAAGYHVRAMSRMIRTHAPPAATPSGVNAPAPHVTCVRADVATGEGLDAAVRGVDVVVHAASAPPGRGMGRGRRGDTRGTDVDGTARLLAAARRAGVRHVLYVSIVGADRVPLAYYRHKCAAEDVVRRSGVPWTVQRGTQFHPFLAALCRALSGGGRWLAAFAPAGWLVQPVDAADFADALWARVAAGPAERAPDVAGPEVLRAEALVRVWLAAQGAARDDAPGRARGGAPGPRARRPPVIAVPVPGRLSAAVRAGGLTAPAHAVGRVTWAAWLHRRHGAAAGA